MVLAPTAGEITAEADAQRAEWLRQDTERIVSHLRRLDKARRDHILAAINKQLLEAR